MYVMLFYDGGFDDAGCTTAAVVITPVDCMAVQRTAHTSDGCGVICEQMATAAAVLDLVASDVYNIAGRITTGDGFQHIIIRFFYGDKRGFFKGNLRGLFLDIFFLPQ